MVVSVKQVRSPLSSKQPLTIRSCKTITRQFPFLRTSMQGVSVETEALQVFQGKSILARVRTLNLVTIECLIVERAS